MSLSEPPYIQPFMTFLLIESLDCDTILADKQLNYPDYKTSKENKTQPSHVEKSI